MGGDSSQRIAALNNSARRNPNGHISTSGCAPQLAGYSPGNLDPQVNHLDSLEWRQEAKSSLCLLRTARSPRAYRALVSGRDPVGRVY
jgi:hypothetical protein